MIIQIKNKRIIIALLIVILAVTDMLIKNGLLVNNPIDYLTLILIYMFILIIIIRVEVKKCK